MIDIHSHIINEIDDGSKNIEESISIIEKLSSIGFKIVIATPHYITGSKFIYDNASKMDKLEKIKKCLEEKNIDMELYLGNEVFIDHNILSLIDEQQIASLNNSKYILIELPVSRAMNDLFDILFKIRDKGYVPIIAHPERYAFLQEDHTMIEKFIEMGCLFQGNFENIVGKYGKHAKELFLYMLKNNQYHFLATDIHTKDSHLFENMEKMKKKLTKLTSKEKFVELTVNNPLKIIKNENIEITNSVMKKKKFKLFG